MKRDNSVYLKHILDAIEQIEEYLIDTSKDQFYQTKLIQDGVIRQLEIIGEATRSLSDDLRYQYPEVPWSKIIGMRNRMAHQYFNINLTIVWEVAKGELPDLKAQIGDILHKEQGQGGET